MRKILVVEDEKPLANVFNIKFTKEGYTVILASNGLEALSLLTDDIDLIITDLIMPEMNGFEFLEELNKRGVKTKRIVVSNLSQQDDITKVKALGALDFLAKSDTPIAEIVNYVNKLLTAPNGKET